MIMHGSLAPPTLMKNAPLPCFAFAAALFLVSRVHAQTELPNAQVTATPTEAAPSSNEPKIETLVFIRHGEKPPEDDGQLTVRGLNRALALPDVLVAKFGRADYVFAPATTKKPASHHRGTFSYVRPLVTIEPTAIRLGLPVETRFAFDEISGLQSELCTPPYQRATVFIAWEHHLLDDLVKRLMAAFGGNANDVPEWPEDDFDSIFIVRLRTDAQGRRSATFEHDLEKLNGESDAFPQSAVKP